MLKRRRVVTSYLGDLYCEERFSRHERKDLRLRLQEQILQNVQEDCECIKSPRCV